MPIDTNIKERIKLAETSKSAETLRRLGSDENIDVRRLAAKNLSTDAETLKELSKDEIWYVRLCVAFNPSTPAETLRLLKEDKNIEVKAGAKRALERRKLKRKEWWL
jgi:adenylate kinase